MFKCGLLSIRKPAPYLTIPTRKCRDIKTPAGSIKRDKETTVVSAASCDGGTKQRFGDSGFAVVISTSRALIFQLTSPHQPHTCLVQ